MCRASTRSTSRACGARSTARGYSQRPDTSLVGVLSGIEIALWDILGKALGKPVYELLGGRVHERLRSYTYIYPQGDEDESIYHNAELSAKRAAEYVKQGFTAREVRSRHALHRLRSAPALAGSLDRAEKFCRLMREAVGSKADLLFGTHGQFTASGAIRLAKRIEPYDPLWFEEPTPPEMPEEMALVARGTSIPIATGERLLHQIRVRPRAGAARRLDPADGARPRRRHLGGQEDRRHGGDALRADRAASLLRPDRGRRQHPVRRLAARTS